MTVTVTVLTVIFAVLAIRSALVAYRITRWAFQPPRDSFTLLVAALVDIFAIVAFVTAIAGINAVLVLALSVRLIPIPIPTLLLIGVLLLASGANELTRLWLRQNADGDVP